MFYAASLLKGSRIDDWIGRAFKVVLDDEQGHGPANLFAGNKYIKAEEDLEAAKEMLYARALQRLHMRNAQFSFPVSRERCVAIMDGDTDLEVVRAIWGDAPYQYVTAVREAIPTEL